MLITSDEIIEALPISSKFPPNLLKDAVIQKQELLLANQFLGETFYSTLESDKASTGTFNTAKYQTLYDKYLKTLIAESVLLSVCIELSLQMTGSGVQQLNGRNSQAITQEFLAVYKQSLSQAVEQSKLLTDSFLTDTSRSSDYSEYLQNTTTNQTSKTTKSNVYAGFYYNPLNDKK